MRKLKRNTECGVRSTKNALNVFRKSYFISNNRAASLAMVIAVLLLLTPIASLAQPMTTPNYRLDPNVANSFGGLSNTGNYGLVDSGGEAAIGFGSSGSYKLSSGYVSQLQQSIELNVLPSGLVAYYPFNTGTGIQAYDVTPNSNQGVLTNGPTWAAGKVGSGALVFDGVNDYVQVADNPALKYTGGDMTLSAWVKPDSAETAGNIISKPWNSSGDYNYRLVYNSNSTITFFIGGATTYSLSTTLTAPATQWTNVTATVNAAKQVNIYINGNVAASGTHTISDWTPTSGDSNLPMAIATLYPYGSGWAGDTNHAFQGEIDQFKKYSRAISDDEALDEYNASNSGIASALTLPKITAGASQTVDAEAVVITDAGGYDLSIEQDKDLTRVGGTETIPAISASISNPDPWNEGTTTGLGFTVTSGVQVEAKWGTDPNFEYAAIPGTSTTFHSRIGLSGGAKEITGLRFRLGIDGSQTAGMYTNRVGFTATLKP